MSEIDELRKAKAALQKADAHAVLARMRRDKAVRAAHAAKIKAGYIAEVAGISAGRVTQIVSKERET